MSSEQFRCWGVIPAAGIGSRMSSILPKQYLELRGSTVLEHSIGALLACPGLESVVVALHPEDERAEALPGFNNSRIVRTRGGEARSDSVRAGLTALERLASPEDWVLVHDAARPCVPQADIMKLVEQVSTSGVGGILAEPIVDTVKQSDGDGRIVQTLDRSLLWRAQTPQMFRFGLLREALNAALAKGLAVTDEASAMEVAGYPVQLVTGSVQNMKITLPADLHLATYYLDLQSTGQES